MLAAVVAVGLGLARPVVACEPASRFELFERAERVIVGTITTPLAQRNYHRRGRVTVAVQTVIKGTAPNTLTVRADIGMCATELSPGATALMFLDRNDAVVSAMQGYVELDQPALVPIHRAWPRRSLVPVRVPAGYAFTSPDAKNIQGRELAIALW